MLVDATKRLLKTSLDHSSCWLGPHRRQTSEPRLWILMYHRVLPKTDPRYTMEEPGMVVEPETFAMHMDLVQEHFTPITLQDWLERRNSGQALPPKSCAITFDDGWLDNFQYAFPILERKGIPATIFVVTHMIGTSSTFWPNRLARLLDQQPEIIETFPAAGATLNSLKISNAESLSQLVAELKMYPDDCIHHWLDMVDPSPTQERCLMNWEELRSMVSTGLVDVGSHSCHHYRLRADLSQELVVREITHSKRKLEQELERPALVFCYPNGDSSPIARDLVAKHYKAAVTTNGGINSAHRLQPFELLRIAIHEDRCKTVPQFSSRLANWY